MLRCAPLVLLAAATVAPPARAQTVAAFLERANPVRDQGIVGMLSPDVPELRRQAMAALRQMRAERDARRDAGRAPLYCKPGDEPDPSVEEMIDALNDLPRRQQRTLPLKDGIVRVMARMYPCR